MGVSVEDRGAARAAGMGRRPVAMALSTTRAAPVLLFVFALMPLTFIGGDLGQRMLRTAAWAWILDLILLGLVLVVLPLPVRSVRSLLPYLAFLGMSLVSLLWTPDLYKGIQTLLQISLPAVAYLVARNVGALSELVLRYAARICLASLGVIVLVWGVGHVGAPLIQLNLRPAATSLAILFVVATVHAPSWRRTAIIGVVTILIASATGSRTASVVLFSLLLLTPSLRLSVVWRAGIAAAVATLLAVVSQTQVFKERFFFDTSASLVDVLTLSSSFNTSGRRELWNGLTEVCSTTPLLGKGIGAAYGLSLQITNGVINQPHNDYLRTYCDAGLIGSVLVWTFFLFLAIRSVQHYRQRIGDQDLQAAAGIVVLAFLLFAVTDNVLVYAAQFMAPLGIILGLADGDFDRALQRPPPPTATPGGTVSKSDREGEARDAINGALWSA
jgi:O-antigen ligase